MNSGPLPFLCRGEFSVGVVMVVTKRTALKLQTAQTLGNKIISEDNVHIISIEKLHATYSMRPVTLKNALLNALTTEYLDTR